MSSKRSESGISKPHDIDELFKAVGRLAIVWSYLDYALTLWIEAIHDHWGGKEIEPNLPLTAFNRKLSYIRVWWKSDESNQIAFPMIPDILDKLNKLAEQRQWAIHGVALHLTEYQETGIIRMHLRHKRDRKKTMIGSSNIASIKEFTKSCLQWCAFLGNCISIFHGLDDDANDAFGELVVKLSRPLPLNE